MGRGSSLTSRSSHASTSWSGMYRPALMLSRASSMISRSRSGRFVRSSGFSRGSFRGNALVTPSGGFRSSMFLNAYSRPPFKRRLSIAQYSRPAASGETALHRPRLPRNAERAFERGAVPAAGVGCGRIGRGEEIEQERVRIGRRPDGLVGQDELAERWLEAGARRHNPVAEARRLRIGVGVERGAREGVVAGPKTGARELVRIGLARERVRQPRQAAGTGRRRPPRDPRHREVEAAPEEMHRARLAEKTGAEELEDAIGLDERAPEAMRRGGIVGGVDAVLREADRVRDLVRHLLDRDRDAEAAKDFHERSMEVGDGLRLERQRPLLAAAGSRGEAVADEVELELEDLAADRNRRGSEPARRDVERNLPAVVGPRRQRQPDLADDLRPELQGRGRLAPRRIRQSGPEGGAIHGAHGSS